MIKSPDADGLSVIAKIMRDARPKKEFRVQFNDNDKTCTCEECDVSDENWKQQFIEMGFDPNGVCGPTYWRISVDEKHYYCTVIHPERGVFLLITEIPKQ